MKNDRDAGSFRVSNYMPDRKNDRPFNGEPIGVNPELQPDGSIKITIPNKTARENFLKSMKRFEP